MTKNKLSNYLIFVSILTLISVIVVIFNQSYNNLIKPANDVKLQQLLKPFNPQIDTKIVKEIIERQDFNE